VDAVLALTATTGPATWFPEVAVARLPVPIAAAVMDQLEAVQLLLLGRPGVPGADLAALKSMLLRVSQMADDLPQITELGLSPVIARRDGALAADVRVRLQPAHSADAYPRQLR